MGSLDVPSRKLFIKDIEKFYKDTKTSQAPTCIWSQGTVVRNNECSSDILIDDGTGILNVLGNDRIPNCPKAKKGQYVMVIGQVLESKNNPVIRAIKVQDLTACVSMETLWMLEVIDQTLMCYS